MSKRAPLSFTQSSLIVVLSITLFFSLFVSVSLSWRHARYTAYVEFIEVILPEQYERQKAAAIEKNCQRTALFGAVSTGRLPICDQSVEEYVRENFDCFNCPKNE